MLSSNHGALKDVLAAGETHVVEGCNQIGRRSLIYLSPGTIASQFDAAPARTRKGIKMSRLIHVDECGYTGQNLLTNEQPLLVIASVSLPDAVAQDLKNACFSGVKAFELKYRRLRKTPSGRASILKFIQELHTKASSSAEPLLTTFTVHKRFNLLTLLIDWWVECAMHEDGIDLYEKKANLALANRCYMILESLAPKEFAELLNRFESMMRERSTRAYQRFWSFVGNMFDNGGEEIRYVLTYFLGAELRLGFRHLLGLPTRVLDVTTSCVLETVAHYRRSTSEPFIVVHDEASYMSHDRLIWDALTKPEQNPQARRIEYPLGVEETRAVLPTKAFRFKWRTCLLARWGHWFEAIAARQSTLLTSYR